MNISISFCIPTYKRLNTLTQAVQSILSQTALSKVDYEILVSDDSADVATKDYVTNINNPAVRYIENTQHGQFPNLNNLIAHATKEWIVFLHDDDFLLPGYLSQILPFLAINTDIDYCWGSRELMNQEGLVFNTLKSRLGVPSVIVDSPAYFLDAFTTNDYTDHGRVIYPMVTGLMIKRALAKSLKFDSAYSVNADGLFLWQATCMAQRGLYINTPVICYRWLEDTERAKPSELGIIFFELESMLYKMLQFTENLYPLESYTRIRRDAVKNFYKNAIGLDSPLMWLSLRYRGGYFDRIKCNVYLLKKVAQNYGNAYLNPFGIVSVILSFLPQSILRLLYKIFLLIRQQ